jgi:hypothetical protein
MCFQNLAATVESARVSCIIKQAKCELIKATFVIGKSKQLSRVFFVA